MQAEEFDGMFLQACLEQRDDGSLKNSVCLGSFVASLQA
jgi:hypothetical protein